MMNPDFDAFDRNIKLTRVYPPKENTNDFRIFQSTVAINKSRFSKDSPKSLYLKRQLSIKALNIIGYFGIIIGCLYQCFAFLAIYFEYPTTVELNVQNEAILDFPAVTVCNSNPVKYKIWCQEDKEVCIRRQNETIEAYRQRQDDRYDRLGKKRRIKLGYTLKEFIIYAEYEEKPVVNTFKQYYDYEFTNCFTFNAKWSSYKAIKSAFVFNPITGKASELVLCVNMDVENYSDATDSAIGKSRMTIHANDIIPNPSYDAASLEAGFFYSFGVQKVTTRLLKHPYQTKCRNYEEEKEYRTGARMSQKNCLLECFKTETEMMCSCTYRRLALVYDAIPCENATQFDCLKNEEDRVFRVCNPQCPMACQKVEYVYVTTDSEPLREESSFYEKTHAKELFATPEDRNKNMACMRIQYGSTETRTLTHRPQYAFIELFSLLGGYSGLWLGFSLLNGHEIVLTKLVQYLKKKKASHKRKAVKKKRRYY